MQRPVKCVISFFPSSPSYNLLTFNGIMTVHRHHSNDSFSKKERSQEKFLSYQNQKDMHEIIFLICHKIRKFRFMLLNRNKKTIWGENYKRQKRKIKGIMIIIIWIKVIKMTTMASCTYSVHLNAWIKVQS